MTPANSEQQTSTRPDEELLDRLARFPANRMTRAELEQQVANGDIEAVMLATPDIQGKLFGKSMPGPLFLAEGTADLSSSPLVYDNDWNILESPRIGSANGWADMHMSVDWRSLRRLAVYDKTAIVFAGGTWANGEPAEELPRQVLASQLERANARGLGIACAVEPEFFLFGESYESAREKNYAGLKRISETNSDYSIFHIGLVDPLLADIRRTCVASGVPIEAVKHELGGIQLELTLTYSDAMEAADRAALLKLIVKQVCRQHGVAATFMARYSEAEASSSGHMHASVWDLDGHRSLMAADDRVSLSDVGRAWLGGQMHLAPDLMLLYCPNVNSYKRLDPDTFAPTTNGWSIDVRTVPFRQVGRGSSLRIENRIPGADANFYLSLAAMIASGLYGIEHGLEPRGEPITAAGFPGDPLPGSLPEALERFRHSEVVRELFGDRFVEHLVSIVESELELYARQVSDIERRRSFECA